MGKSLFIDFCQIFKNKKSKIRHLGLCCCFERFLKTLFYKKLVLLRTTKCGRVFLKNLHFRFSEVNFLFLTHSNISVILNFLSRFNEIVFRASEAKNLFKKLHFTKPLIAHEMTIGTTLSTQ
jgi:hypothetical protein